MSDKIAVKKKMSEKDNVLKRSMFYLGKKKKPPVEQENITIINYHERYT